MLFDFHNYLYTITDNDIYSYFNDCYSTAILTRSDLKDNILNHRMNFLIDYYVSNNSNNNNHNKSNLKYYYLKNYKDNYNLTNLNHNHNSDIQKNIDITEDFDKDVRDHYLFITSKPPPEPEIDYEEIDKKFYLEEEEKRIELENKNNFNELKYDDYDYDYDGDENYYYEDYDEDDYYNCSKDDYY